MFERSTSMVERRRGHWHHCDFAVHYRKKAARSGVFGTAKAMRKQGFRISTALSVLVGREVGDS